jgi:hypothetical protein
MVEEKLWALELLGTDPGRQNHGEVTLDRIRIAFRLPYEKRVIGGYSGNYSGLTLTLITIKYREVNSSRYSSLESPITRITF